MMDNPKTFLLKKIVGYKENGMASLGHLNALHVEDIAKVMLEFAQEMVMEVAERIGKGETVDSMNGYSVQLPKRKSNKHKAI